MKIAHSRVGFVGSTSTVRPVAGIGPLRTKGSVGSKAERPPMLAMMVLRYFGNRRLSVLSRWQRVHGLNGKRFSKLLNWQLCSFKPEPCSASLNVLRSCLPIRPPLRQADQGSSHHCVVLSFEWVGKLKDRAPDERQNSHS